MREHLEGSNRLPLQYLEDFWIDNVIRNLVDIRLPDQYGHLAHLRCP
jgi:hypothetical protein